VTEKKHLQSKYQVRIQSSRFFLMEDEPMRMRLKPSINFDKDGNRLPDLDSNGNVIFEKRKFYANFRYKGKPIGNSLISNEGEDKKAQINLDKLMEKLENGETVGSINKKLRQVVKKPEELFLKKTGETNHQFVGLWNNHVCRLLGEYKACDLTPKIMAQYMEDHWGLNEDEELQVMYSSFNKEC